MPATRTFPLIVLVLAVTLSAALVGGCSTGNPAPGDVTPAPIASPKGPTVIPGYGEGYAIFGRVYLDGSAVFGADVEAVAIDGGYRASNMTDQNGVYHLVLPAGVECNITARYQRLTHTVWPVRVTGTGASYNVYMTAKPTSIIMGTGVAYGGPLRLNGSKINFSGFVIRAVPANVNATVIAPAADDGSYYLEVVPGVQYAMDLDIMPAVTFLLRNTDTHGRAKGTFGHSYEYSLNVTLRPDETALVDYEVFLP